MAANDVDATVDNRKGVASIRRPTQERGRIKFDAILDTAEVLLQTLSPEDISAYNIAAEMQTSPPTVYHFFPSISLVFVALAERYLAHFRDLLAHAEVEVGSWQEFDEITSHMFVEVYRNNAAIHKVLLGSGYSTEIRRKDVATDYILAQQVLDELQKRFIMPEIPDLVERFLEAIVIGDAIFALSIHQHGQITAVAEKTACRARQSYLRTILPEYLVARPRNRIIPTTDTYQSGPTSTRSRAKKPSKIGQKRGLQQ